MNETALGLYTTAFYEAQRDGSRRSAEQVVPLLLQMLAPRSVIDVGCGVGTWLAVFRRHGVEDAWGIDGSHVDAALLEIPAERRLALDLECPLRLHRRFDLVLCLEVAEHLPARSADQFVESLTTLGPVILFSAAVPFQGGTGHVNEQWPRYWAERFARHRYAVVDAVRPRIWENSDVDWWYAQNTLLFAEEDYLSHHPQLERERRATRSEQLALVHPRQYVHAVTWNRLVDGVSAGLDAVVPEGERFILVDDDRMRNVLRPATALPFPERHGAYWGPPADDAAAIAELERLRGAARFIVFAAHAFWWLEHYEGFHDHLRSRFRRVLTNRFVVVFDLHEPSRAGSASCSSGPRSERW